MSGEATTAVESAGLDEGTNRTKGSRAGAIA
jgi:hypothetical protein